MDVSGKKHLSKKVIRLSSPSFFSLFPSVIDCAAGVERVRGKGGSGGGFNSFPLPTPPLFTPATQARRVTSNGLAMPLVRDGRLLECLIQKRKG